MWATAIPLGNENLQSTVSLYSSFNWHYPNICLCITEATFMMRRDGSLKRHFYKLPIRLFDRFKEYDGSCSEECEVSSSNDDENDDSVGSCRELSSLEVLGTLNLIPA